MDIIRKSDGMTMHTENAKTLSADQPCEERRARILLVEGVAHSQDTLAEKLREAGQFVIKADSGASAMVLFAVARIEIVFAAHELPDMTGLQLLGGLQMAAPLAPVILMSEEGDPPLALALMRAGALDVVSHSAGWEEIQRVLQRALGNIDARSRLSETTLMHRDARQQIARNEARLRAVLSSTTDPLLSVNHKGIIESASDSVEREFGWKPAELLGQNISVLTPEPYRGRHDDYMKKYLATGETTILGRTRELEAVRKDGTVFPCEVTVWQSDMPGQSAPIFTGIIRDITQRRQSEETLRKYALDLELANEVQERESIRIAGLVEELSAAQVRAEQASQAKNEFLANMSHEIRTPMTAILGFAENLLDPLISGEDRRDAIQTIQQNGRHLLGIINDILDLSKIEAAKLSLERLECPLMQTVNGVISLMQPQAKEKNLSLSLHNKGPVPATIQTDPTRLRQILINLLGNAIKFTNAGNIRLVLEMQADSSRQNPLMEFCVIDTGMGISPEQQTRLFEPFSQADESTTRLFGGTGLGLAICQRLARMLGGEMTVRSQIDQGSTFSVTIDPGPIGGVEMIRDVSEAIATSMAAEKSASSKITLAGRRILLAEDGIDNQRLISFVLKKAGAEVQVAENGEIATREAMSAVDGDRPFDVILMDMQMPVLDGYEATRQLRQQGYRRAIIALTAHAMSGDRERCLDVGCDDYAIKPIQRNKLLALIASYAARNAAATADDPSSVPH